VGQEGLDTPDNSPEDNPDDSDLIPDIEEMEFD
jgi:hypothetical protein